MAHLRGEILALSARLGLDPGHRDRSRRRPRRGLGQARQSSVRAEGNADPRRPARVRPSPGGRPAHRSARGFGKGAVRQGRPLPLPRLAADLDLVISVRRHLLRWQNRGRAKSQLHCSRLARMPGVLTEIRSSPVGVACPRLGRRRPAGTEMDCNQRGARADRALSAPRTRPQRSRGNHFRGACAGWAVRRAGSSGAPTRVRPDVLPTGRSFFSVDSRAVPTAAAWHLGWRSAALLIERYVQEHGDWPRAGALGLGHGNMRTGGDDLAQALTLLGARPLWDGPLAPGHRHRDPAAQPARPPPRRCHAAGFGLFPRRVPGADRVVRSRGAGNRGARRAG